MSWQFGPWSPQQGETAGLSMAARWFVVFGALYLGMATALVLPVSPAKMRADRTVRYDAMNTDAVAAPPTSRRSAIAGVLVLLGATPFTAIPVAALRPGCDDPDKCSGNAPVNILSQRPKSKTKLWAPSKGCTVAKPCNKAASLFGPAADLGAKVPKPPKKAPPPAEGEAKKA